MVIVTSGLHAPVHRELADQVSARRPARVLWLSKGLGRGGAERLLVDSSRLVDPTRFAVDVAYLLPWKDALVGDLEREGVPTHCLRSSHPLDPTWVHRLRKLHRERRYDLIHTHMPYVALGARLALGPDAPPVVHTEHNVWERYRLPTRWANRMTYHRNAAVIAVSHAVADSIQASPMASAATSPSVEVLQHGASLDNVRHGSGARREARARLGVARRDLVVGTVGNFTLKKDHRTLLDAIARLAGEFEQIRLVLVGTGPLEEEVRRRVDELGLTSRVLFTGMRDDVYDLLSGFDVFALSSRHEGLPIALLEGMATGLPCVVTRVGGVPEVVRDGIEGFLVEPGSPELFSVALRKLLSDGELRTTMGQAAMIRAGAFDLSEAVVRTQEIYDLVLAL